MELTDDIKFLKGVGEVRARNLNKLGIFTAYDLLMHIPRGYDDQSTVTPISELRVNEKSTVLGRIEHVVGERTTRNGAAVLTVILADKSGSMQLNWFGKRYLKDKLKVGERIFATGKVAFAYRGMGQLAMSVASFELLDGDAPPPMQIVPIYGASGNLTQKKIRSLVATLFDELKASGGTTEILPPSVAARYNLMSRAEAFSAIHFPRNLADVERARSRLAFEELYLIQCGLLFIKNRSQREASGIRHMPNGNAVRKIIAALPFNMTKAQERTWREVCADMERDEPMRRLVQGDVGSGKTIIAALALAKTAENGCQGAFMAPTEILATQHFSTLSALFADTDIRLGFLSGRLTKNKRDKIYRDIAAGELDIVVGTHALIEKGVVFHRLGLAVTDEQHRFGVAQRAAFSEKNDTAQPDMLVMTATPIPRSLTLTLYGDLNVSVIDELPPGRQPIRTFLRGRHRRPLIYEYVRKKIDEGRQAYVVCPRVEFDENSDLPSVEEIAEELSAGVMSGVPTGILHGKLKSADKDKVMSDFADGKIKLLVATTVIEVGIDVPNACIMVVEFAERFGLSQLHQLRGRVGRGDKQSFCILISDAKNAEAKERLSAMEQTSDGFLLAQKDLEQRGPGQFFGKDQHGLGDLKVANVLRDLDILLKARRAAQDTARDSAELVRAVKNLAALYGKDFLKIQDT